MKVQRQSQGGVQTGGRIASLPSRALADTRLTGTDRNVLTVLCHIQARDAEVRRDGWFTVSQTEVAKLTFLTRPTVNASIKRLDGAGYIEQEQRWAKSGSQLESAYRIIFDADLDRKYDGWADLTDAHGRTRLPLRADTHDLFNAVTGSEPMSVADDDPGQLSEQQVIPGVRRKDLHPVPDHQTDTPVVHSDTDNGASMVETYVSHGVSAPDPADTPVSLNNASRVRVSTLSSSGFDSRVSAPPTPAKPDPGPRGSDPKWALGQILEVGNDTLMIAAVTSGGVNAVCLNREPEGASVEIDGCPIDLISPLPASAELIAAIFEALRRKMFPDAGRCSARQALTSQAQSFLDDGVAASLLVITLFKRMTATASEGREAPNGLTRFKNDIARAGQARRQELGFGVTTRIGPAVEKLNEDLRWPAFVKSLPEGSGLASVMHFGAATRETLTVLVASRSLKTAVEDTFGGDLPTAAIQHFGVHDVVIHVDPRAR